MESVASPLAANNDNPAFEVGDKAVHPAHGVGEVAALEEKEVGGSRHTCYVLKMLDTGLKVMVPTSAASRVGLRPVMKKRAAEGILDILRASEVAVDLQPWNRRFRAYTEMLKSGAPEQIARVLRDMYRLKFDKALSFGERRLLDQARSLLVHELALAKSVERSAIEAEIREIFAA
ncbi:MAG: CarD family transcriptional regulator [Polyangiaceae bacterium]|nr:CarD family transcriptional regulator [Polyangiaceae bacterium]